MSMPDQEPLFEEPPADLYPASFIATDGQSPLRMTSLLLDGLKGFDGTEVELKPLTILTGPNDSGKSTVLQGIALAYECFRRCLDADGLTLRDSGRAVQELDFLPVQQLRDLWFKQVWRRAGNRERPVRVGLTFSNDLTITFRIRYLFGSLNIGLESAEPNPDPEMVKRLIATTPVLLPASPGPPAHEQYVTLGHVHRWLSIREPSRVLRNILLRLQDPDFEEERRFLDGVARRYFSTSIESIEFDELRDLEIRAPLMLDDCRLDVISAGSGANQLLQIAAVVAWRKPGVLLLDEPEAHLHTSLQGKLLDFLDSLVDESGMQVILATHSRDLISQAPLESIVPVDRKRAALKPLASIDHLLLEFERQGVVSNVDLALLYQTKKCLFVEGASDVLFLPKVAERLGIDAFTGRDQVVLFEIGGVDQIRVLPNLVGLFRRLVGADLSWAVIRDGDVATPVVRQAVHDELQRMNIPAFHIWSRYTIENYLLDPTMIAGAVAKRRPGVEFSTSDAEALLDEVLEALVTESTTLYVNRTQAAFRRYELSTGPLEAGTKAAVEYLASVVSREDRLRDYPGKSVYGQVVERLQQSHGVNIRILDLVEQLTPTNADDDLKDGLGVLTTLQRR